MEGIDLVNSKNSFEIREPLEEFVGRLQVEQARPEHLGAIPQIITEGGVALRSGDFRELARLDWRFHMVIGEATRNPKLAHPLLQLLVLLGRLRFIAMSNLDQVGDVISHWQVVLDALERRSAEEASKALVLHMVLAHRRCFRHSHLRATRSE